MKLFTQLNLVFLFAAGALSAHENQSKNNSWNELNKNSIHGYVVPFVLRYDPDHWFRRKSEGGNTQLSRGDLRMTIYESKTKTTQEQADIDFQESLKRGYADSTHYSGFEVKPSEMVVINGINFLHQKAIINLIPKSRHLWENGRIRYVGENGARDQIEYYTGNADKGEVALFIEADHLISSKDQADIDELLRGFSFDGSACQGPKPLRALKDVLDFLPHS